MNHIELKAARQSLGISLSAIATLLDTDADSVRRMEMEPHRSKHRRPAPRMVRLIEAYLAGYRPADWPKSARQLKREIEAAEARLTMALADYAKANARGTRLGSTSAELARLSERIIDRRADLDDLKAKLEATNANS